jgi:hypothetical protein
METEAARSQFWSWFAANGDRLRGAVYSGDDTAREAAMDELRDAVAEVAKGVVLELGRGPDSGPGQLIVSADGRPAGVDLVKELVGDAPAIPGWEVIAFRPRMQVGDSIEIAIENERVGPADVHFDVTPGEEGLALTLYVRGLTEANKQLRGLGASLLAEHAVGERDALTLLGSLDVQPLPADPGPLRPFGELVGTLAAAHKQKYPPPGRLSIPDDGWLLMRGTIQGAPAMLLFNSGLRPYAGHPVYDRRLTVSIPFHEVDDEGMPGSAEFEAASAVGDLVAESLTEGQQSLYAMAITGRGRRDLVFYASDPDAALSRVSAIRAEGQTHPIEVAVEWDSFWDMFSSFADAGDADRPTEDDPD